MDELIATFLDTYITEEFREDVLKSFDLFDFYEYNQAYAGFIDILTNQGNISNDELKDSFVKELHTKLDYILEQHTLKLIESATIAQKNDILSSLAHIQKLEDYTGIIRILESFANDDEQLSIILSDATMMDQTEVLSLIESFNPSTLSRLKDFIYQKEDESKQSGEVQLNLLENLKLFNTFANKESLGALMLKSGTLLGDRFITYYPFIEDDIAVKGDNDQTALNFLSVLYLSADGYNSPLLVYRKYSFQVLKDLNLVSVIEVKLLDLIGKYTEFRNNHNEAKRISQVSAAA